MSSDTATAEKVALVDHAERILEVLRHREPSEADRQACSMLIAGLRMLEEVRGPDAVAAFLGQAGPIMAGHYPGGPADTGSAASVEPLAPVAAPSHADLVAHGLTYLRGLPLGAAMAEANAAMETAGTFLHQALGDLVTHDAPATDTVALPQPELEAAATAPRSNPDDMALALLAGLRNLPPDQGHEQARAAMFGAAAYLIEQRGPAYTAAVSQGLQANALRHVEVWGASPRPPGVALH